MKKTFLMLCGLISLSFFQARAQDKDTREFGDVTREELLLKKYLPDTSAAAVILFDQGEVKINLDGAVGTIEKRHVRIKFFHKSAFAKWANVTLYVPKSKLSKLKAVSYSFDATSQAIVQTPVDDDAIFKTRINKYVDRVKFTFPAVTEGSVIEYSYVVKHYGHAIPSWTFQYSIPVQYSEYLVDFPFFTTPDLRGALTFSIRDTDPKAGLKRYAIRNIPAFREEPFMPHENIYRSVLFFRNAFISWHSISNSLMQNENFGQIITEHEYLKEIADRETRDVKDDREKIKRLADYVRANVTWNEITHFYADEPKKVLEAKEGSSGDINLMLASLLKKAGFDVAMVLISTREHGVAYRDVPSLLQFNDVICLVRTGKDTLLLDATEKRLPYNVLPVRCLNYIGLVIRWKGPEWISIAPSSRSRIAAEAEFQLTTSGLLKGKFKYTLDGYEAREAREEFYEKGSEQYAKDFAQDKKLDLIKSEILNIENPSLPVEEIYTVEIPEHVTMTTDRIYLNPYLALREETQLFTEKTRIYPVDFVFPMEKIFIGSIEFPEEYAVDEMPKSSTVVLPDKSASCVFNYAHIGHKISITSHLTQSKTIFMPEEYPALKEFYDLIISKKSEQIVLKKIK